MKESDAIHRCAWCGTDPLYVAYHDQEWGVPERDARALVVRGFLNEVIQQIRVPELEEQLTEALEAELALSNN